jgi:hypothetical protein
MAEYIIRNSLNPDKVVKCSITFRKLTNKEERAEPVWLVHIATEEPHKNGGDITPSFIHLASLKNLNLEIDRATEKIAAQVDWGELREDLRPPMVSLVEPIENGMVNVGIMSNIIFDIEDLLPAAGIDIDSIKVSVNGMDVTNELDITGDAYKYRVTWKPFKHVLDYY